MAYLTPAEKQAASQAMWDAYRATHPTDAPAPTTTLASGSRGALPSASEISRVFAAETSTHEYIIQQTDVIEVCFAHLNGVTGLIYSAASVSNGTLADPASEVRIGRTPQHLTEIRTTADEPWIISETSQGQPQSLRTYVKGPAGTHIILKYR